MTVAMAIDNIENFTAIDLYFQFWFLRQTNCAGKDVNKKNQEQECQDP